jgi:hypothetical protein
MDKPINISTTEFTVVTDFGKPDETKVKGANALFKELVRLRKYVEDNENNLPYAEVHIYVDDKDYTDWAFDYETYRRNLRDYNTAIRTYAKAGHDDRMKKAIADRKQYLEENSLYGRKHYGRYMKLFEMLDNKESPWKVVDYVHSMINEIRGYRTETNAYSAKQCIDLINQRRLGPKALTLE